MLLEAVSHIFHLEVFSPSTPYEGNHSSRKIQLFSIAGSRLAVPLPHLTQLRAMSFVLTVHSVPSTKRQLSAPLLLSLPEPFSHAIPTPIPVALLRFSFLFQNPVPFSQFPPVFLLYQKFTHFSVFFSLSYRIYVILMWILCKCCVKFIFRFYPIFSVFKYLQRIPQIFSKF